jgi:DNA-binding beta-propeller fold protein YncE
MQNHTVVKFSLDGTVLMSLGERNVPGNDEKHFNRPTDVAVAANGDFYVTDGYGNARVVKFDKTGKFLKSWGKRGTGEGELHLPHAVVLDDAGLVYVADRENNRVQVFDPEGKFIRQFGGFAPYGLFLDRNKDLYIADGRANQVLIMTLDGAIKQSIGREAGLFNLPHWVTVGADGAVYVAEVGGRRLRKFVSK